MHKRTISLKLSLQELRAVVITLRLALQKRDFGCIYQNTLVRELMNGLLLKIANKMYNWSGPAGNRKSISVTLIEASAYIQLFASDDTFYGEYEDNTINRILDIMDQKIKSNQQLWTLQQSFPEGTILRV